MKAAIVQAAKKMPMTGNLKRIPIVTIAPMIIVLGFIVTWFFYFLAG